VPICGDFAGAEFPRFAGLSPASAHRKQMATVSGNEPFTMIAERKLLQR
jgi:hypothetical protein